MSVAQNIPRLFYLGDVPVEPTYHGSALLYRLFSDYATDRLRIANTGLQEYVSPERLQNVRYSTIRLGTPRLLSSRLHRQYGSFLMRTSAARWRKAAAAVREFSPEAIVTVAHGYGWIVAAKLAENKRLPLHLIIHDDWPHTTNIGLSRNRLNAMFRRIYRQAATRLCVSPYMEREYRARYGIGGTVLFPSRAESGGIPRGPSERRPNEGAGLVFAFAGTINSQGYARVIASLAAKLGERGGELIIFGPHTIETLRRLDLARPNVRLGGFFPSHVLLAALREQADVLIVPMSFEGTGHEENMRLSFPSKLADYTATGVALLIWGPPYSSAVRWALENTGVAEVVTTESGSDLPPALERLSAASHRRKLATKALQVGTNLFGHAAGQRIFRAAIAGNQMSDKPCA